MNPIIGSVIGFGAGVGLTFVINILILNSKKGKLKKIDKDIEKKRHIAEQASEEVLNKAHLSAKKIKESARKEIDNEISQKRKNITEQEKRIYQKERFLDEKEEKIENKNSRLESEFVRIQEQKKKQEEKLRELVEKLEKISGMTQEEARSKLMSSIEVEMKSKAGRMIRELEEQTKKLAKKRSKEIIIDAIQRTVVDHIVPATTSVVELPDEEMKGRIIGKEGRNIRAFESITGVDIIVDDTPETVTVSSFDPLRREIAKIALQNLVNDGRIQPTKIEDLVIKAKEELMNNIVEKGEAAADELGLSFHPKIIEYLGKLSYRTSYGQNMLAHSIEAAHVAGIIAQELGVNVQLAKRGTVLHDIGKAVDFEQEGTHTSLGKQICEKHGESPEILNCIMAHHEEEDPITIEAIIVKIADKISSARPGARRESVEKYIKRLEKLESLAQSFDGVEKVFAIQAGREIRVIVKPDIINDDSATKLAFDISQKIEQELDYPGEIKVSVIREVRATSVAK